MALEKEVKIKVNNIKNILKKIVATGAKLEKKRLFEDNYLLDFPKNKLFRAQKALRVRICGRKCYLTFKGVPLDSLHFKIREEWEIELKDKKSLFKILEGIGLEIKFRYQKIRTTYIKNRLRINLDETPIGYFLELEGEEKDINEFSELLGFKKKDYIKSDYIQLFKAIHDGDMVFSKIPSNS